MIRRLGFLLALMACAGLRLPAARRVERIGTYVTRADWQNSPWYRSQDGVVEPPVHLLIATGGWACVVPDDIWASAFVGDYRPCPTGWRSPRFVTGYQDLYP